MNHYKLLVGSVPVKGRKKRSREQERTTTFALPRSLEYAMMELQKQRFLAKGRRPSQKELIVEALELLVQREGIALVRIVEPISIPEVPVATMPIRQPN